jgi:RimJ/RimL family protein N-acetyltransferase
MNGNPWQQKVRLPMNNLLRGKLVYLAADNPATRARNFMRWNQDSEWIRLLDTDPPRMLSEKKWLEWFEKDLNKEDHPELFLSIHTLDTDVMIGFIGLFDMFIHHGDALVAIALGEREYWGKGYGTDAMQIMLRYAFSEVNLSRVGLIVFEYNSRAIRSYEKAGFTFEGRVRGPLLRDGKRWDYFFMGILKEEWLTRQHSVR